MHLSSHTSKLYNNQTNIIEWTDIRVQISNQCDAPGDGINAEETHRSISTWSVANLTLWDL